MSRQIAPDIYCSPPNVKFIEGGGFVLGYSCLASHGLRRSPLGPAGSMSPKSGKGGASRPSPICLHYPLEQRFDEIPDAEESVNSLIETVEERKGGERDEGAEWEEVFHRSQFHRNHQ